MELACGSETVNIWVNFVASERSGESPALVVGDTGSRVFKTASYVLGGERWPLRFPAPNPPFSLVACSHEFDGVTVTLEGVLIP